MNQSPKKEKGAPAEMEAMVKAAQAVGAGVAAAMEPEVEVQEEVMEVDKSIIKKSPTAKSWALKRSKEKLILIFLI